MWPTSWSVTCYIRVGWKSSPGTNTLAFWAYSNVMKKIVSSTPTQELYLQHFNFLITYKWTQKAGVLHYTRLKRVTRTNTLAYWAFSNVMMKKSVVNTDPGTVFTTLTFLRIFQMRPTSWSVIFHQARKAYQGQTHQLIGLNQMLWRKKCCEYQPSSSIYNTSILLKVTK
jgi:hypothetical protein